MGESYGEGLYGSSKSCQTVAMLNPLGFVVPPVCPFFSGFDRFHPNPKRSQTFSQEWLIYSCHYLFFVAPSVLGRNPKCKSDSRRVVTSHLALPVHTGLFNVPYHHQGIRTRQV